VIYGSTTTFRNHPEQAYQRANGNDQVTPTHGNVTTQAQTTAGFMPLAKLKSFCYFHGYCIGKGQKTLNPFLAVPDEKMCFQRNTVDEIGFFVRHSLSLSLSQVFVNAVFLVSLSYQ
jgi:hypothetical protein